MMNDEERTIYEWQYGAMGDFRKALMLAICRADENNIELLRLGFPIEVNGYVKFHSVSGWWQKVQEKAKKLGWRTDI